jgi:hypothetical protein
MSHAHRSDVDPRAVLNPEVVKAIKSPPAI